MRLSEDTQQALRTLIETSPALLAQLQQSSNVAQSAQLVAEAARAAQIDVTEEALRAHLGNAIQEASAQALTDGQLDQVAAGLSKKDKFIMASVLTFGTGCAIYSLMKATRQSSDANVNRLECWDMMAD
jgi:hypothetical protein